ncbi:MAG: hypothetical protein ACYC9M_02545 [Desulfobulbaceae bacterium]
MRQHLLHIFTPAILLVLIAVSTAFSRANPDIVTLTLPEAMIKQTVQNILPLQIVPEGDHLQGKLVLDSISKLELRDNGALIKGMVLGSGLSLKTKIGDQSLNMKIGEVRLPLTCDFTFRFDPARKILYVTPRLEQPQPTENPQADAVLPLLTLLGNKEYPVSLDSLQTFTTKVGEQDINVTMEPVDIHIAAQQMVVKMRPKLRKVR